MPNKDRSFHESPEKAGGEGWLYSEQQQKLCHFKPDTATVHAQWVAIRTYSYVPLRLSGEVQLPQLRVALVVCSCYQKGS